MSRAPSAASTRADTLTNKAWQAQFSWFLTGEEEAYRGFTPGSTWQPGKPGFGAIELVARYHELDVDDDAFTGGANSFANPLTAISKETRLRHRRQLVSVEHREAVAQLRTHQLRRRRRGRHRARGP